MEGKLWLVCKTNNKRKKERKGKEKRKEKRRRNAHWETCKVETMAQKASDKDKGQKIALTG